MQLRISIPRVLRLNQSTRVSLWNIVWWTCPEDCYFQNFVLNVNFENHCFPNTAREFSLIFQRMGMVMLGLIQWVKLRVGAISLLRCHHKMRAVGHWHMRKQLLLRQISTSTCSPKQFSFGESCCWHFNRRQSSCFWLQFLELILRKCRRMLLLNSIHLS